jgi:hypothetical protein
MARLHTCSIPQAEFDELVVNEEIVDIVLEHCRLTEFKSAPEGSPHRARRASGGRRSQT